MLTRIYVLSVISRSWPSLIALSLTQVFIADLSISIWLHFTIKLCQITLLRKKMLTRLKVKAKFTNCYEKRSKQNVSDGKLEMANSVRYTCNF